MNKIMKTLVTLVALLLIVSFSNFAETQPVASSMTGSNGILWQPKVSFDTLVLTVSTPEGEVISKSFSSGSSPYFDLSDNHEVALVDGSYTYELRVTPLGIQKKRGGNADRNSGSWLNRTQSRHLEPLVQSGHFSIKNGSIVTSEGVEPTGSLSNIQGEGISRPADQVILDDLIVDGSLCVGQDCVNGESFGFDTIRLKENNLRIKFQDTSNSASFPTNDWEITINDSSNGGASYFAVTDVDGSKVPFKVTAGARSNSIFVSSAGKVGFGTSTPSVDLHTKSGNTPTLRLEQDGTSGFTPQTWDVAGNEANFFIRDVTNGSKLPFRIEPGTPSNALYLDSTGDIGLGTTSPAADLEIEDTGSSAKFWIQRTDGATGEMIAKNLSVAFGANSNHPVEVISNDTTVIYIDNDGDVGIGGFGTSNEPTRKLELIGGAYSDGNDWYPASSIEYKENVSGLDTEEALSTLSGLEPVKYNYKNSKDDNRVGFIAEEVPDLVATPGRKNLSPMDIVAVLTKVVKEQQKTISELKTKVSKLEENAQNNQ